MELFIAGTAEHFSKLPGAGAWLASSTPPPASPMKKIAVRKISLKFLRILI